MRKGERMHIKVIFTMACMACCLAAQAQREIMVVDMVTKQPMSGVAVTIDSAMYTQRMTNYRGRIIVPIDAKSVTLSRQGYEVRNISMYELPDTVELMRTYQAIGEAVIYGSRPTVSSDLHKAIEQIYGEIKQTPRATPLARFDFFKMFTARKDKRQRESIEATADY